MQLRPVQVEIKSWLHQNWDSAEVLAVNAPTGTGKSLVLSQVADFIITPSNNLIDQYQLSFPGLNILKGAEHYTCKQAGDCGTHKLLSPRPCAQCPHQEAKKKARSHAATVANPLSYYYLTLDPKFKRPDVLGIDEADRLEGMLTLAASLEFKTRSKKLIAIDEAASLIPYLESEVEKAISKAAYGKAGAYRRVLDMLTTYPDNYRVYQKDGTVTLYPYNVTTGFLENVTASKKLILMSATLFEEDVKRIAGRRSYKYLQVDSPIPVENRRVIYSPMAGTSRPNGMQIEAWIRQHWDGQPAICHVTYAMQEYLANKFPKALTNTSTNKQEVIEEFRKRGGLWLASGCHEGIDLAGDICRLNLIPMIPFDNLGDPVVINRKNQAGGSKRYRLDALRKVIQMAGRTSRGPDDFSTIRVGDPRFAGLVSGLVKEIPESFLKSITWRERK